MAIVPFRRHLGRTSTIYLRVSPADVLPAGYVADAYVKHERRPRHPELLNGTGRAGG